MASDQVGRFLLLAMAFRSILVPPVGALSNLGTMFVA